MAYLLFGLPCVRQRRAQIYQYSDNVLITQAVRPGFSFRLSFFFFFFFFFRVQSQIAVWPLERMRHLCLVRHGSFTEVVVA